MGDLLIPGSGAFVKYIIGRMDGEFEVGSFEENEAAYLGMGILKLNMLIANGSFRTRTSMRSK